MSTLRDKLVHRCTWCGAWSYGNRDCDTCGTAAGEVKAPAPCTRHLSWVDPIDGHCIGCSTEAFDQAVGKLAAGLPAPRARR